MLWLKLLSSLGILWLLFFKQASLAFCLYLPKPSPQLAVCLLLIALQIGNIRHFILETGFVLPCTGTTGTFLCPNPHSACRLSSGLDMPSGIGRVCSFGMLCWAVFALLNMCCMLTFSGGHFILWQHWFHHSCVFLYIVVHLSWCMVHLTHQSLSLNWTYACSCYSKSVPQHLCCIVWQNFPVPAPSPTVL